MNGVRSCAVQGPPTHYGRGAHGTSDCRVASRKETLSCERTERKKERNEGREGGKK